jgi:serine/threonine-protein kinase
MDENRRDESQTAAETVADEGRPAFNGPVPIAIETTCSGTTPSIGTLQPGYLVAGRYRIDHLLGVGGMGAVYKAADERLSRAVALKTLAPFATNDSDSRRRFETEARAASAIHHPGVVAVYDFGVDDQVPFIVLELLRGEDLSAVLNRHGRLNLADAADVMLGVCAGVWAAHEAGVIHRDLKPSNVFIVNAGAVQTIKVLDFGVSKLVSSGERPLTGKGDIIGTLDYMSPEQAAGRPVDKPSDQFSLGVIFYRCLTGRTPHRGAAPADTLRRILSGDFPRPRELVPELPTVVEDLICRTMASDPQDRLPSVHHLGRELLAYATERGRRRWLDTFDSPAPVATVPPISPPSPAIAAARAGVGTQTFPAAPTVVVGDRGPAPELPPTHTMQRGASGTVQPVIGQSDRSSITASASTSAAARPWRRWAVAGVVVTLAVVGVLLFRGSSEDSRASLVPTTAPVVSVDAADARDATATARDAESSAPDAQLVAAPAEAEAVAKPARPRKPRAEAIKFTPNGVPILR